MANFSLPIIFLNLGGEMFYVLDQRLKAQNIQPDKAKKVLNEIALLMLNQKFLEELFKPQKMYSKHAMYALFHDIAHASVMKLNSDSMGKLYDLMTMVFKYQMFSAARPMDVLYITLNHMCSLRCIITSPVVHRQLDITYMFLSKTYFSMNEAELQIIRYDILNFLQDIKTKVSIFLRQGQQNMDGTFIIPTKCRLPLGYEVPGVIKLLNGDNVVKEIMTFSPGGEYAVAEEEKLTSLDLLGKRNTSLGLTIYSDAINNPGAFWWESNEITDQRDITADKSISYKEELNILVAELLGNKITQTSDEMIDFDLFQDSTNKNSFMAENEKDKPAVVTIGSSNGSKSSPALLKIAEEMNTVTEISGKKTNSGSSDILQLMESIESTNQ